MPGPDRDAMRAVAASLGDRANAMAARGRVAEVPALWEEAIAALPDEASRALITLAYAWYQALHGEVEHGIRLAAGLRDCPVPPVPGQVRVLVRNRTRVEPEVVERTWHAVTGEGLAPWAFFADEDIDAVAAWISALSWEESRALYDARVSRLASQDADEVLVEIASGDPRLRTAIAVHRAVLVLGADAGYHALSGPKAASDVAGAAITAGDWGALRACGTIELTVHGRAFLGGVYGVTAELMAAGDTSVPPAIADRVAALALDAQPWERARAAADLAAIGDTSITALLSAIPESSDR
ncbi:hypothetical protein [Catenulispora sp. GP43]|uniref:hypothetical protein n=1 Tax=Catenulispora sp. GP43 TaxID=3156263 RepID=UPI00351566A4